jgi:hypothetical protein
MSRMLEARRIPAMNLWSPWLDPAGDSLRGVGPERYALAAGPDGQYLRLAADDTIETVTTVDHAFQFHTHEKAVHTARSIAAVLRRPVDVIKLL